MDIQLNADGTITGDATGTWAIQEGTSYFSITLDREYKGVIVEQTLEPTNDKTIAFTALNRNGVTVWGYCTNSATGISSAQSEVPDDVIYDLQGRRIITPQKKGIYIRGGKKFIVR